MARKTTLDDLVRARSELANADQSRAAATTPRPRPPRGPFHVALLVMGAWLGAILLYALVWFIGEVLVFL